MIKEGYDVSMCDVSHIEDFARLFKGKTYFNQDISRWELPRIRNMRAMFFGASRFNQDLSRWKIDSNNVILNFAFAVDGRVDPAGERLDLPERLKRTIRAWGTPPLIVDGISNTKKYVAFKNN